MPDNEEELKKQNLWRCDCNDEGEHISTTYHESGCNYALWYVLNFDNGETDDEEI
jgi:hypothetical protein